MRENITEKVLAIKGNVLAELPTGFGKSKLALTLVKHRNIHSVLIVIPRLVLKKNWSEEINKWLSNYELKVSFSTYVSLPKLVGNTYESVIFDECHHLSERCLDALMDIKIKHSFLLTATLKKEKLWEINTLFKPFRIKVESKEAMEEDVLPTPKVEYIPLSLDNIVQSQTIVKNSKGKETLSIDFKDRWKYINNKAYSKYRLEIKCTEKQYYDDITSTIEYYKKRNYNEMMKNKWLKTCGDRLKWLSSLKKEKIKQLLKELKDKRTILFCASIEDTEYYGNPVNSKISDNNLKLFNEHKINHISCVNMLDEGVNLADCQIGIWTLLNASERMNIQKIGRLLRHKNPILYFLYFENTREEEIINKIKEEIL